MGRRARIVIPGIPHHVTQRGNRRQETFFGRDNYDAYLELLKTFCEEYGVAVWAYCLMPNHIHLIVVPSMETSLAKAIGEVHRRYTRRINFRMGWRGYLWQGRFSSNAMAEEWLMRAVKYTLRNPVKAKLVSRPEDWYASSIHAHLSGTTDGIIQVEEMVRRMDDWDQYLREDDDEDRIEVLRRYARTGRVLGSLGFILELESRMDRRLRPMKPGPKGPRRRKSRS